MENYIVRIYRRDESNPDSLTGTFESVENETQNSFTSLSSLIELLIPKRSARAPAGKSVNNKFVKAKEPVSFSD